MNYGFQNLEKKKLYGFRRSIAASMGFSTIPLAQVLSFSVSYIISIVIVTFSK